MRQCELHDIPLKRGVADVVGGPPALLDGEEEASRTHFINACSLQAAYSLDEPGGDETADVWYCDECRMNEVTWRLAHGERYLVYSAEPEDEPVATEALSRHRPSRIAIFAELDYRRPCLFVSYSSSNETLEQHWCATIYKAFDRARSSYGIEEGDMQREEVEGTVAP